MSEKKIIVPGPESGHPATVNRITIRGTIVSARPMRNAVSLIVASDAGSGINRTNYPNITFRNKDICRGFLAGDRVTVTCHARIFPRRNLGTGKYEFPRELVGEGISFTDRALADYVELEGGEKENGGLPDDVNAGIIAGKLTGIYVPENNRNISIITVETGSGKHGNRIEISCFDRQAHVSQKMKKGDWCAAAVSVRTLNQDRFEDKNYNTVICKDIYTVSMQERDNSVQENTDKENENPDRPADSGEQGSSAGQADDAAGTGIAGTYGEEPGDSPEQDPRENRDFNGSQEEADESSPGEYGNTDYGYNTPPDENGTPGYPESGTEEYGNASRGYNTSPEPVRPETPQEPQNPDPSTQQDPRNRTGSGWGRSFRW